MNPLLKAALALEAAHSRIEPTTGDRTASELVGKAAKLETCKERVTARSKQSEHASSSPLETGTSNEVDRKADFEPRIRRELPPSRRHGRDLNIAGESAGTAVCISPVGLLLTCSHCISEDPRGPKQDQKHWLLFSSGGIVQTECIAFDAKRDLALLRIIAAQSRKPTFPFLPVSNTPPKARARIVCIGHPGSEDLENPLGGATDYAVLSVSSGRFRGLAPDRDVHDNSEIGALKHDCWTYWGHSGAPLVDEKTGTLMALHSSWDEETGMRRGIAWQCIGEFLEKWMA